MYADVVGEPVITILHARARNLALAFVDMSTLSGREVGMFAFRECRRKMNLELSLLRHVYDL